MMQYGLLRPWIRAKSCSAKTLSKKCIYNEDMPLYHVKDALFKMSETECHVFALNPLNDHQLRLGHSYGCGLALKDHLATRDCQGLSYFPRPTR